MPGDVTGYNEIIPLIVLESLPAEQKIKRVKCKCWT